MSTQTKPKSRFRGYAFLGLTQSLCPECLQVVPTKIIERRGRIYFRKTCPTHGTREDFVCSDATRYDRLDTVLPAKSPKRVFAEVNQGCPMDCGLCSEHEQHTCIGVVEITDNCNLTCPMCYAASGPGQKHKTALEVTAAIDRLVEAEGRAEVLQLSGGEPTLHPDIIQFVQYAVDRDIDYVMINTNGIRLSRDLAFVESLAEFRDRLEIYFQFDSLDDQQIRVLRGASGLLDQKLRALENLAAVGLNVTLVSTLQGGVNNDAPAELLNFAAERPNITGISLQPATYSGRSMLPSELEDRITFPDVIDTIAADARNDFGPSDFFPLPCAHPNCHWIGLGMRTNGRITPLTKFIDATENLDLLANGISFTRQQVKRIAKQILQREACGGAGCCTPESNDATGTGLPVLSIPPADDSESKAIDDFLAGALTGSLGARDVLRITITSFLDAYNFDVRRVMKCCTHHVLPSGHIIPFCAYNVLYRDGIVPLPPLMESSQ